MDIPANASPEFAEFYRNYISTDDMRQLAQDGLNFRIFEKLKPDELAEAERLMLLGLSTGNDRAIEGLGTIRSPKAVEPLRAMLAKEKTVSLVLALWRIEQNPQMAVIMGEMASDLAITKYRRENAVRALAEMPSPEAQKILMTILEKDREFSLRFHSFDVLLKLFGYSLQEAAGYSGDLASSIMGMQYRENARQAVMAEVNKLIEGRSLIQA